MLNVEIRNSLANVLSQNGKGIAQDPVGLQAVLRSEAAQYPREIGMIVNAARAGIPTDITNAGTAINDLRPRMVEKLQNEQAFPQDVAEWVVETWISALSMADTMPAPVPVQPAPAPAPVEPTPVAQAPTAAPTPVQAPHGQVPQAQPYQQYGQFQGPKKNTGKTVAIAAIAILVVAGLGVGGFFLFRGKGATPGPVAGTTGGTTTGGMDPGQLFSNGGGTGGTTGGAPGTTGGATGGGPGTTGGGTPPDTGGGPGTNNGGGTGGDPGNTNGGSDGGNPGATGGGQGEQSVVGTYRAVFDPVEAGEGCSGTLNLNADMSFAWEMAAPGTTMSASGHMANGGGEIVLNMEKATANGKEGDPSSWKMSLVPAEGGKFLCHGTLADRLATQNIKLYWVR